MAVIATIAGTGLRPGISKNKRYYSPELIERAVARAQARIDDEDGRPITMRVGHPLPDTQAFAPVTETAGRITSVAVAGDGSMRFTADLYDNSAGRDVLALYDTRGQKPALKNVSIRGRWLGETAPLLIDGVQCEAAADLELDGIDFTHLPGVDGAQVDKVAAPGAALESAGAGALIYESCEETHVTDTATEAAPATPHADLGYLPDGQARWPLGTLAEARDSWVALHESATADQYSARQLKRVRARAARALRGHGVEVRRDLAEGAGPVLVRRGQVAEGGYFDGDYTRPGSFYVTLDNGAVCVSVSSCSIDPHDLGRIGTAAMAGAVQALLAMDPDDDGDIDVPGAPRQDADHGMEAAPPPPAGDGDGEEDDEDDMEAAEAAPPADPPAAIETPASTEDAANTNTTESEAPVMADANQAAAAEATPATEAATPAPLTMEALAAFGAAMGKEIVAGLQAAQATAPAVEAAPAQPAAEAAPAAAEAPAAVAETEDQRIARLVQEGIQAMVADGQITPGRKGLVGKVTESGALTEIGKGVAEGLNEHGLPVAWAGDKPAHELKGAERSHLSATLLQHVVGHRL